MTTTAPLPATSGPRATAHALCVVGPEDGRPLVLAHGFGTDQPMWAGVLPALTDDCQVVLFDHAGSGASDPAAWSARRHASLDGYAEDLVALLEELALGPWPSSGTRRAR